MLKVFRHTIKIKKKIHNNKETKQNKKKTTKEKILKKNPQRKTPPNIINAYHCVHT